MGLYDEIRSALHNLAARSGPRPTILAIVKDVDEKEFTCTLQDDNGALIPHVRLRPVIDGKESLTLFPQTGTWAMALRVENDDDWVLTSFGEVAKWRLKIGEAVIEQNDTALLIQNGTDTLKQVLELIIESVMSIVVVQGKNPDYIKLQEALTKAKKILR